MAFFSHQDCDGDAIELLASADDPQEDLAFLFSNRTGRLAGGVRVDRDAALRLRDALNDWLGDYGDATPPPAAPQADNSLIDQLIRRAAAEAVTAATDPDLIRSLARDEFEKLFAGSLARVLPLHLAPFAERIQAEADKVSRIANALMADPEPGDVGHPRPATEPQDHGRLMAELPKRVRPRGECVSCGMPWPHAGAHPLHLCRCGHCSRQHAGSYGYAECGVAGCECRQFGR